MICSLETVECSLGTEPYEVFGFSNEEELELVLIPLMQEISEEDQN